MEIFQDGAFPNLEYNLFQVNWCVLTLIKQKNMRQMILIVRTDISIVVLSIFGHI